ncbi:MAG TPA: CoA transferase, partial [Anaerolineae bacterium]|nr:CoA transferase [Anaerolineae bacterium]
NNYLALSGLMSHSGRRDEGPPPLGAQIADIGGGAFGAVVGILTAVIHRQQTGEGQLVDISVLDMSIFWQAHVISGYLLAGEAPQREGWALNGGSFYDFYETRDGRYLSVGSLEPKFWRGFCQAIERPDLAEKGASGDTAVQQSLKQEIRAAIAQKTLAEWQAVFAGLDVCVEPVLAVPEMINHPQVQARQMIVDVPKGEGETQKQVGSPFKFSGTEANYWRAGGDVGEDTAVVLAELGYTAEEIAKLQGKTR